MAVWFAGLSPAALSPRPGVLDPGLPPPAFPSLFEALRQGHVGWELVRTHREDAGIRLLEGSRSFWARVAGDNSRPSALLSSRLAAAHYQAGRPLEARKEFAIALPLQDTILGPEHKETVWTRNLHASFLASQGEYEEALPVFRDVIEIRRRTLDPDDPDLAWTYHNYANSLHGLGKFGEAEEYYRLAVEIRRKGGEELRPYLATSLLGLAICGRLRGEYAEAITLAREALEIETDLLASDDPGLAVYLSTVGRSFRVLGNHEEAMAFYDRVLGLLDRDPGEHDVERARCLAEVAEIRFDEGDFDRARRLREEVLPLFARSLGEHSVFTLLARAQLARTMAATGDLDAAGGEFGEVIDLLARYHPEVEFERAWVEEQYATSLFRVGEIEAATVVFERSLATLERGLPGEHALVVECRQRLAEACRAAGQNEKAWHHALIGERAARRQILAAIRVIAERNALQYLEAEAGGVDLIVDLAVNEFGGDPGRVEAAWNVVMESRTVVFDEMVRRYRTGHDSRCPEWKALRSKLQRISNLRVRIPDGMEQGQYLLALKDALADADEAERALAHSMPDSELPAPPTLSLMRTQLPADAVLVSFVRFRNGTGSSYAAFVLLGPHAVPRVVDLGDAGRIDTLVERLSAHMEAVPGRILDEPEEAEEEYREIAGGLAGLIWDPLEKVLDGRKRVFLVPDGPLRLVDLYTFPAEKGTYLVEHGLRFTYLTAESDLVPRERGTPGRGMLVAGVDWLPGPDPPAAVRGGNDCSGRALPPLPSAEREQQAIISTWKETCFGSSSRLDHLAGSMATEAAVKDAIGDYEYVHIVTHGVSVLPGCDPGGGDTGREILETLARLRGTDEVGLMAMNLVLGELLPPGRTTNENGMLTSEEIAMLNLDGTRMVSLSACGTFMGKVTRYGVYGLARSFLLAGAGTVFTSPWSVGDPESATWMITMYRFRFENGLSPIEAWRKTDLEILFLRRSGGDHTHPFYWAGYMAIGEWR